MSLVYITTEAALEEVVAKEMRPFFDSQKVPIFGLDYETSTLFDRRNEFLYGVPQPIPVPPRRASNILTKKEMLVCREGFTALMQMGADPLIYDRQWLIDTKLVEPVVIKRHVGDILSKSFLLGHSLRYECGFLQEEYDIDVDPRKLLDVRIIDLSLIAGSRRNSSLMDAYRRYIQRGLFIAQTGRKERPGMDYPEYEIEKKEMQESEWGGTLSERQLWYGADDVRLPFFVYHTQKEKLREHYKRHPKSNLLKKIKDECALIPEASRMFVRGFRFDSEYHNSQVIPYLEKKKEEEYALAAAICPNPNPVKAIGRGRGKARVFTVEQAPINFRAPLQIKASLKLLKVNVPDTQEDTLKEHRDEHPAVEHILRYKKAANMLSKYGHMLPNFVHLDGKLHPDFGTMGTETNRFTYWKPPLQTIPNKEKLFREINAGKLFRTAFIPSSDEYVIIDADLPNIEPRLIAQASGETRLLTAFSIGLDYHGFTAQILMDLEYIPLKGDWHREKIGKIGNLSLGYGAGPKTLKENMLKYTLDDDYPIRWTDEVAKEKHAAYFAALPAVAAKIEEVRARVERAIASHETLADFAGQRRIFEIFSEWPKTPERSHMTYRSFYLMDWQEQLAKVPVVGSPKSHPLHKWYQVVEPVLDEEGRPVLDEETGEPKMKRHYYNAYKRMVNDIAREAYNFTIQAEGSAILKRIIIYLGDKLREHNFPKNEGLLLTVHDELIMEVHKSRQELAISLLEECMEKACREILVDVPIKCEAAAGRNWAEAADPPKVPTPS